MKDEFQPVIQIDTRELEGQGWGPYFECATVRQKLDTGDYSLVGAAEFIALERKSLTDLVGCLTGSRDRFTEELRRGQKIGTFYVLVEATHQQLLQGDYRSAMTPKSAWESVVALQERFKIPFFFCGDTPTAAKLAESILLRWFREHERALDECRKAVCNSHRKLNDLKTSGSLACAGGF